MRLDQFLKISRIIKRRTVAKAICDDDRVMVNGNPAKAGKEIHEGDILRLNLRSKIITCQVLSIPLRNVSISEAPSLYKILSEENMDQNFKP